MEHVWSSKKCADPITLCLISPEQYSSTTSISLECLDSASQRKRYNCCGVERCLLASRQALDRGFRGSRLLKNVRHRFQLSLSKCRRICFCARREVLQSSEVPVICIRKTIWSSDRRASKMTYNVANGRSPISPIRLPKSVPSVMQSGLPRYSSRSKVTEAVTIAISKHSLTLTNSNIQFHHNIWD